MARGTIENYKTESTQEVIVVQDSDQHDQPKSTSPDEGIFHEQCDLSGQQTTCDLSENCQQSPELDTSIVTVASVFSEERHCHYIVFLKLRRLATR